MTFSGVAMWLIAAAPIYMPILIAVVSALYKLWVSKLPANQRPIVQAIVHTGVTTAAQVASDELNGTGKKELATQTIEQELAHWNIKVPESVISAMIEETVAELPKTAPATILPTHIQ